MTDADQWTVQGPLRTLRPLWKYSWPNGDQVYVAQSSGEVVQYTTTAIPHRRLSRTDSPLAVFHAAARAPAGVEPRRDLDVGDWHHRRLLGIVDRRVDVLAGEALSPRRRAASLPYRGQKRWHAIIGLIFGVTAATWAFSGMLSMDPLRRPTRPDPCGCGSANVAARGIRASLRGGAGTASEISTCDELELASFEGEPVYLATLAGGELARRALDGDPRASSITSAITDVVTDGDAGEGRTPRSASSISTIGITSIGGGERPLPVIVARLNDAERTRYYIDPKTARVVGSYSARGGRRGGCITDSTHWIFRGSTTTAPPGTSS